MPGSPPTSPVHGAPRYSDGDSASFSAQVNGITDRFDITAVRWDRGLSSARPTTGTDNGWWYSTDTRQWSRYTTALGWEFPAPSAHAASHQDGGTDALTVREAMMATGATGMAKGAFRAYRNAAASLATAAVVVFDTDTGAGFDISGWYDPTTGRFAPQIAGYYRLSWRVASITAMTVDAYLMAGVYKNGSPEVWAPPMNFRTLAAGVMSAGTDIVVANGTTDFFDVRIDHNNGGTLALTTGLARTAFSGHLIGRS